MRHVAVIATVLLGGCFSWSVEVPPHGAPPEAFAGCTTSRSAPIADLVIAGVGVAATAGAIYAQRVSTSDGGGPILALGFTVPMAVVGGINGARGMAKVGHCRRGLARLRRMQGPPGLVPVR